MKQYLKSFTILSFSIFFITFTACDNEPIDSGIINQSNNSNNTGGGDNSSFVGDWETISFETQTTTNMTFMGETSISNNEIVGVDMDYIVSFTESAFVTSGNYSMHLITLFNGVEMQNVTETYPDVSGSGTYTTNGNTLTTDGAFFEFDFEGVDTSEYSEGQSIQFTFSNGGQTLKMVQYEEVTINQSGAETTTIINSVTIMNRL